MNNLLQNSDFCIYSNYIICKLVFKVKNPVINLIHNHPSCFQNCHAIYLIKTLKVSKNYKTWKIIYVFCLEHFVKILCTKYNLIKILTFLYNYFVYWFKTFWVLLMTPFQLKLNKQLYNYDINFKSKLKYSYLLCYQLSKKKIYTTKNSIDAKITLNLFLMLNFLKALLIL